MKIIEIIATNDGEQLDINKLITELKSKRYIDQPDVGLFKKQIDPMQHDVMNPAIRKDKWVKADPADPNKFEMVSVTEGQEETQSLRQEKVARIATALQKLIVKRDVSFIFGNPVELDCTPENDLQKKVLKALERIKYDVKEGSLNRKVARNLFSCTEVAEYWYPVESANSNYGFNSKYKLRCAIFSPLLGDTLYPYFDETGDMVAFSRLFTRQSGSKTVTYFETYTDEEHWMWMQGADGYVVVDGFPKSLIIGKIPIVFGNQDQTSWADVQNIIDRLEMLLSQFADTNIYHSSPKIVVKGELTGFAKKGEAGAILQLDGDNAEAKYLSWDSAPESVKLEIQTLLTLIYTITQTPDISFDSVKGIGNVSGVALKLMFMDAHLKVADHREVFDEYLQRRINIQKAYLGVMNKSLQAEAENLMVTPEITPYIIRDEASEIKIWTEANGGNPVMSQKASFQKARMTSDPEADFEQYQAEQDATTARQNSFTIGEPTQA